MKVAFYVSMKNGDELIVVSAVGHLYTIVQTRGGWTYPVFDITWTPSHKADKRLAFTKAYLDTIINLGSNVDEVVSACDYDQEGSLIAFNIIKHGLGDAALGKSRRMLYSTLTETELNEAWDKRMPTLDYPVIASGKIRHEVDWLYGINLSRALTLSVKKTGAKKTLSMGRVQGPTLKFVYDQEFRINTFVPIPYWKVSAETFIDDVAYPLEYCFPRLKREIHAEKVARECRGKHGLVTGINRDKEKTKPPSPFNLGDLQQEAYRVFKFSPSVTLKIAEKLYLSALISYPRTSSQMIPDTIDMKSILKALGKNKDYSDVVDELIDSKRFKPRHGKMDDPAHPAIYPTGNKPGRLKPEELKVYDLITRRFLSSMGKPSVKTKSTIEVYVNNHLFLMKGEEVVDPGWIIYYQPYTRKKEVQIPALKNGEIIPITKLSTRRQYTKPPSRFTSSSLTRKMEVEEIGTKTTRSNIVDTLYRRGYISGQSISITDLGSNVIEELVEYSPDIIDVEFTRSLEERLERIQSLEIEPDSVIEETESTLSSVLSRFKEKESEISKALSRVTEERI
jgi:DNA topoisomerase-1